MHRNIEITLPAEHTAGLIERLQSLPSVIGLSVVRGGSRKPPGDVIRLHALNQDTDEVLRAVQRLDKDVHYCIALTNLTALLDNREQERINDDVDDSLWEEIDTGLRSSIHITGNYLTLMALGGAIAACGWFMEEEAQGIAFVASSVIAPGFEPVAKMPLGLVLRKADVFSRAAKSFVAGYAVLLGAAAVTTAGLRWMAAAGIAELTASPELLTTLEPRPPHYLVSVAGALAGIIMIVTYRDAVIAGPLIAMTLIPAAALAGAGLGLFEMHIVWGAAKRFGIDVLLIFVLGAAVIWLKQRMVHRREPMS